MASITETKLIDDLDGTSEADETVDFTLDGKRYEIDLTKSNAERLRGALAEFVAAARKAGGRPERPTKPDHGDKRKMSREETAGIRQWVRDNGGQISDRGRIPIRLVEAYQNGDTSALSQNGDSGGDDERQSAAPTFAEAPSF